MSILRNLLILVARVGLGIVFVAHGWQKFFTNGIAALVGGAGLVFGAITPLWGALLFANMTGAYLVAHIGKGLFVSEGGGELVVTLGAGALLLLCTGAGRFSVDGILGRRVPWHRLSTVPV